MRLFGDEAQVEARFGPFGDSATLDAKLVHGLRRTYLMRTSSTIARWQRRNKKRPSGLVVVGRRPCEPLNNPTLLSLGGGSHLKRQSHPSPIGLVF
jgi:hypothetical protein